MSAAIKVENLSKAYQLGEFGTGTISRDIEIFFAKLRGKEDLFLKIGETNNRDTKGNSDVVWSLRDINFQIEQGDTVGIIGRNGAGKSTLLKILSRVTAPTTGSVKIKGRVASLLEVGTGFHPELTGRENIFLNGAILGMRKAEITRRFDEIVDFAGVERYIDTPVKRYSSGMYVRLAFGVAAHLESEILIVDEVLAVGDAEFQKKCLGKMSDVSKGEGRTVLFVSHNIGSISQLCATSMLLENGELIISGPTNKVVGRYLANNYSAASFVNLDNITTNRKGNKKVIFRDVYLKKSKEGENTRTYSIGDAIYIYFSIQFNNPNQDKVKTAVEISTDDGLKVSNMIDVDSGFQVVAVPNETSLVSIILNDVRLYPGVYNLTLYAGDMSSSETYDYIEDCCSFEIIDGGKLTKRYLPRTAGLLFFTPQWAQLD